MMTPPGLKEAQSKLTPELKAQQDKAKKLYQVFAPTQSAEYIAEAKAFNQALKDAGLEAFMSSLSLVVPEVQVVTVVEPETPVVPQVLLDNGGRVWVKGEHARVYFNSPADAFDVDFGSNNKNRQANGADLYFDLKRHTWIYTGSNKFEDDIIDAASAKTGL